MAAQLHPPSPIFSAAATTIQNLAHSPSSPPPPPRGWVALLRDVLVAVFRKLDHVEILMGTGRVCRSWCHAARDDPALWRRIDMRGHADLHRRVGLCGMARAAIHRAVRRVLGRVIPLVQETPNYGGVIMWNRYDDKRDRYGLRIKLMV
ncbi:putative F-box/LRR-repeat protein 9 [Setaria italica]|uniref:putative F-box/LRR-repeat protein 9 n=1 Tax=Setaria italica TaxID=4555 RepID=UPI0006466BF2|nr:putative F-box/LRR-repeat protein 9 [Setaria italica]